MSLILTPEQELKLQKNRIVIYDDGIKNIHVSQHVNNDCKMVLYTDSGSILLCGEEPIYGQKYSQTEWRYNFIGGHAHVLFGNIILKSSTKFTNIVVTITVNDMQNNYSETPYIHTYNFASTTQETIFLYKYIKTLWSSNGYISISINNSNVELDCSYIQCFNTSK